MSNYFQLPRKQAIKIADLERTSLWKRHKLSPKECKSRWEKAAKAADKLVEALEKNQDDQAVNYMFKVGENWWSAAECGPVERLR
jgi:hypothetical protein